MSESHRPRPPRRSSVQPRSLAGRHFIQTQGRTDVFLRIRGVMERHNLSASGAVHYLLLKRFGLPPIPRSINTRFPPIHPMVKDIVSHGLRTSAPVSLVISSIGVQLAQP